MNKPIQLELSCDAEDNAQAGRGPNPKTGKGGKSKERISPITRPIHYLGSKLRIVKSIQKLVDIADESKGPICDLFAGSGTVALALSAERPVIAVDIQEYSRVICSAILHPPDIGPDFAKEFVEELEQSQLAKKLYHVSQPMAAYEDACCQAAASGDSSSLCELVENGALTFPITKKTKRTDLGRALTETLERLGSMNLDQSVETMTVRYFGGLYFSYRQASQIDLIRCAVALAPSEYRDCLLAALLSTVSDLVNTVGKQFAQPIRPRMADGTPKKNLFNLIMRDRTANAVSLYADWLQRYLGRTPSIRGHSVMREDYSTALQSLRGKVSAIYADPPYTRDHYSRFYHVLETLCLRDNPKVSTVRIDGVEQLSRGMYREERHQSPFCIKSKAPNAMNQLLQEARLHNVPLILSYSPYSKDTPARPRLLDIKDICEMAARLYSSVETYSAGPLAHSKLNNAERNFGINYEAESLILCRP